MGKNWTWTNDDIDNLTALCATDMSFEEIGEAMGRTGSAISHKYQRLNIKRDMTLLYAKNSKYQLDKFNALNTEIKDISAWKKRVLIGGNYTCADCGLYCPTICVAHHIVDRVNDPGKTYDVSNGVSLCPNCHATRHYESGFKSSGKRITRTDKVFIYAKINEGASLSEIAVSIGCNKKTIENVARLKRNGY